jgi:hypothetical protein
MKSCFYQYWFVDDAWISAKNTISIGVNLAKVGIEAVGQVQSSQIGLSSAQGRRTHVFIKPLKPGCTTTFLSFRQFSTSSQKYSLS